MRRFRGELRGSCIYTPARDSGQSVLVSASMTIGWEVFELSGQKVILVVTALKYS